MKMFKNIFSKIDFNTGQKLYYFMLPAIILTSNIFLKRCGNRTIKVLYALTRFFIGPFLYFAIPIGLISLFPLSNGLIIDTVAICGVLFYVFFVAKFLKILFDFEFKRRADKQANNIYNNTKSGHSECFSLFIRRFFQDSGMQVKLESSDFDIFINPSLGAEPIEVFLRKASVPEMPLIKMGGDPLSQDLGIGTIYFDKHDDSNQWFEEFKTLSAKSKIIIALPLVQEDSALLNEIEWLRDQGLMHKVVFIMPPKAEVYMTDSNDRLENVYKISDIWDESRESLKRHLNITLPKYNNDGGYYIYKEEFSGFTKIDLYGCNWKSKKNLRNILRGCVTPSKALISYHFSMRQLMYLILPVASLLIPSMTKKMDDISFNQGDIILLSIILSYALFIIFTTKGAIRSFGRLSGIICAGFIIFMSWELMKNPLRVDINKHGGLPLLTVFIIPYIFLCFATCYTYLSVKKVSKRTLT